MTNEVEPMYCPVLSIQHKPAIMGIYGSLKDLALNYPTDFYTNLEV